MSSRYVRRLFESWLKNPAMQIPFYSTINVEENPADSMWCTAEFNAGYREVLTFCEGTTSEDGEVEVTYFCQPGIGYDDLIQALEVDADAMLKSIDPNGKLDIVGRSAPYESSGGSADREYSLSVFFDYQYFK